MIALRLAEVHPFPRSRQPRRPALEMPAGERPAILLASLAGVTTSTSRAWLAGTRQPQARHLKRLAMVRRILTALTSDHSGCAPGPRAQGRSFLSDWRIHT